jgi:N-acetylmuramoyl-L-alanine amidase CwlA
MRLLEAFKFTDKNGEVCPANWRPGKDTIKPDPVKSLEFFSKTEEKKEVPVTPTKPIVKTTKTVVKTPEPKPKIVKTPEPKEKVVVEKRPREKREPAANKKKK